MYTSLLDQWTCLLEIMDLKKTKMENSNLENEQMPILVTLFAA